MNSDFSSFKIKRFPYSDRPASTINLDSILKVPIDSELPPMSDLESIAEITEEELKATIDRWKMMAKGTDFEEILNADIEN